MNKKQIHFLPLVIGGFLIVILGNILIGSVFLSNERHFSELPISIADYDLNDLGVADINLDQNLDIFTTNHSAQQSLLIGDGKGNFSDMLSKWGLSQDRRFPALENSNLAPAQTSPGLYIYRQNNLLYLVANKLSKPVAGKLELSSTMTISSKSTADIKIKSDKLASGGTHSQIDFSLQPQGSVVLEGFTEIPHRFQLDPSIPLEQVYLGRQALNPDFHQFTLLWRDRHSMAWNDFTQDGQLDVFIGRGGIKGKMHELPEQFSEELLSQKGVGFVDQIEQSGMMKNNCPGRQAAWVDYNQDGWLDLYHACGRGASDKTVYPNQLFQQIAEGKFTDVAHQVGLDLPRNGEFLWIDTDQDGDLDLISTQDREIFLYNNQVDQLGQFTARLLGQLPDGTTKKLTAVDYDLDGNLDIYISSHKGGMLLKKQAGKYQLINPAEVGLPTKGLCSNWVDYDNDGLSDLYVTPGGLYHQLSNHQFQSAQTLMVSAEISGTDDSKMWGWNQFKLKDVRCSWFDYNNDGSRDLIVSFEALPSLREKIVNRLLGRDRSIKWRTKFVQNSGFGNHWLELILQGSETNPQAIGATVKVKTLRGVQMQQIGSAEGSYFSQGHYRLYFGLGQNETIEAVEVKWANGQTQTTNNLKADQIITIQQESRPAA